MLVFYLNVQKIHQACNLFFCVWLGLNVRLGQKISGKNSGKTDAMYIVRAKVFRKLAGKE